VAIDVGGTFIDIVMLDPANGTLTVEKQPSTPGRLPSEVLEGLHRLPVGPDEFETIVHGSTVAINALVQERGAKVGLLTTRNFRDVLEIGRGSRPEIDNWLYVPPSPLVPRNLRVEVDERVAADGSIVTALSPDSVVSAAGDLVRSGVESIAICFINSYANPTHEQTAMELIEEAFPGIPVTASCDVSTEWKEFERTYTTVINAYIRPVFAAYLDTLVSGLGDAGYSSELPVMQSNGGVIAASRATDLPVRTVQSGPAGGVIGAQEVLRKLGLGDAICADVGGTTFDVALIESGKVVERTEVEIGGRPILSPTIDIVSIGAGGGSIAWIDDAGALRVGPQSAGALPGPACFGRGGTLPTVTDCQIILGRLDAQTYLGSRMSLDVAAARDAVEREIARPLGMDVEAAALGVLTLAENNMAGAIHDVVIGHAVDPRDFVILAYGGGGGQFATAIADEVGAAGVVVPHAPGVFSAWGILGADFREDAARTAIRVLDNEATKYVVSDLAELRLRTTRVLASFGLAEDTFTLEHRADMRFIGQEYTLSIPIEKEWLDDQQQHELVGRMRHAFATTHRSVYGHGHEDDPIEVVTVRCRGIRPTDQKPWHPEPPSTHGVPSGSRPVCFDAEGFVATDIYQRDELGVDQLVGGPAVIDEWNFSLLVPPLWQARVLAGGELHLTARGSA